MSDQFTYWKSEIARVEAGGEAVDPQRHVVTEIAGYWRVMAAKSKPDWPCLVHRADGQSRYTVQFGGGRPKPMTEIEEDEFRAGTFLNLKAVRRLDWTAAVERGKWPDDGKDSIPKTDAEKLGIDENPPAAGHNMPPDEDDPDPVWTQIKTKLEAELAKAKALGKVDTLDKANTAAAIRDAIRSLGKMGDAKRTTEKAPFDEGAAAVQAKYVPTLKPASETAATLLLAIDAFQRAEQKREADRLAEERRQEAKRIADEEAQRLRDEAAQRAAEAAEQGQPAPTVPTEEEIAEQAEAAAAEKIAEQPVVEALKPVVQGGAFSKATTKAKIVKAKIVDVRALCEHFIHSGDEDFIAYLQKRADGAARVKLTLPGMERVEQ